MNATLQIKSLASFTLGQDWRLSLLHEEQDNLLIWITRGQGLLQLNGSRRGVSAHNAVIVPKGMVFALELGRQAAAQIAVIPSDQNDWQLDAPRHLRFRDGLHIAELSALLEAPQREAENDQPFVCEAMLAHQKLLELWVRRKTSEQEHAQPKPKANVRLMAQFFENLPLPQMQGATMAQHAEKLDVTPTHLARSSRATTGHTAADHLTARLLYQAQCALVDDHQSAKSIACDLNFGSAAYFTRFIQQHTGLTPTQFRQRFKLQ